MCLSGGLDHLHETQSVVRDSLSIVEVENGI